MIPEEEARLVARHRTQIAGAGATDPVPAVRRDVGKTRIVILVLVRILVVIEADPLLQQTYTMVGSLRASTDTGRRTLQTVQEATALIGTIPTEQIISTT